MGCANIKKSKANREVDYFMGMVDNNFDQENINSEKQKKFLIQKNPIFQRRVSGRKEDNQLTKFSNSYITRNK